MSIKIGTTLEKINPSDPYDLIDGSAVGGFDELKAQSDTTKTALASVQTLANGSKSQIDKLQATVDASIERIAITAKDQLVTTDAKGRKNIIDLPSIGQADLTTLRAEVQKLENALQANGVDVAKLKADYGQIDHKISNLPDVFVYSGETSPTYPTTPQWAYFLTLVGTDLTDQLFTAPNISGQPVANGTTLHLSNQSKSTGLFISSAVQGETFDGSLNYELKPGKSVLFIKNGVEWVSSLAFANDAHGHPVTAAQIATAVDHGDAPTTGSIKGLADGWWLVQDTNRGISGRPPGNTGDLIVFKQTLAEGAKKGFGIIQAFGEDKDNRAAAWTQYRDGDAASWVGWFQVNQDHTATIDDLKNNLAGLKQGLSSQVSKLMSLTTQVGGIFAPSQSAFDTEANKLIDAKQIAFKSQLLSEGWGPGDELPTNMQSVYAGFDDVTPSNINALSQSPSEKIITSLSGTDKKNLWVLVPNDMNQALSVDGITVNGSIPARWSYTDSTIQGTVYRVFKSPGKLSPGNYVVRVLFYSI